MSLDIQKRDRVILFGILLGAVVVIAILAIWPEAAHLLDAASI